MRLVLPALLIAIATGCATVPPGQRSALAHYRPSPNHDIRKPQVVVLHYTVIETLARSRQALSDADREHAVSAHYLIGRDGRIEQLVPDHLRAWHAGDGRWGDFRDLNDVSIGIEIVNTGSEPFPDVQIDAVIALLRDLLTRHRFDPRQVIAHADLAPGRKIDPGKWFPWKRLAEAGFGVWPQGELVDPPAGFDGWAALAAIGYPLNDPQAALHSFRLRFRALDDGQPKAPDNAQGRPGLDAEDLRILYALDRQRDR